MNHKTLIRIAFITWMTAITVSSVLPHGDDGILSYKLTGSGMVVHFVGYFVATGLLYWAYRRDSISFILFSGLLIFIFSVVMEFVQFWLPFRTFNPVDIAANGLGVALFVFVWAVDQRFAKMRAGYALRSCAVPRRNEDADQI
jgi:VanZ like protein